VDTQIEERKGNVGKSKRGENPNVEQPRDQILCVPDSKAMARKSELSCKAKKIFGFAIKKTANVVGAEGAGPRFS